MRDLLLTATARAADARIVLVPVSDTSLQARGAWPWRWSSHARLLSAVCAQRPAVVGLDLLLAEQQPGDALGAQELAEAMRRCGNVVLAMSASGSGRETTVLPLPALREAAAGVGHVNFTLGEDGVAREVPARVDAGGHSWAPFWEEMLRVAGRGRAVQEHEPGRLDGLPALLVPVRGDFPAMPYEELADGKLPPGALTDRFVLVGVAASGVGASYAVPGFGAQRTVSGVELLARALNNELHEEPARLAPPGLAIAFCATVLAGVVFTLARVSSARMLCAFGLLALMAGGSAWALLAFGGLLVDPATGVLVGLAIYPLWYWRKLSKVLRYLDFETRRLQAEWGVGASPRAVRQVESRIHALEVTVRQVRLLHLYLHGVLLGMPDASLVIDPSGRVVLANIAAARYFRCGQGAALVGRAFDELAQCLFLLEPGNRSPDLGDLPRNGEQVNLAVRGPDGREMLMRSAAFQEHASDPLHAWIVTLVDVHELRTLERARDEAFSFISHDMRSPQASIVAMIDLHRRGIGQASAEELLPRIESAARDSLALSENFVLTLRARGAPFSPRVIDLVEMCEGSVRELQPQALAKGLHLRCEFAPFAEPAFVNGEVRLLRRALDNLVSNAIKFSPPAASVVVQIRPSDTWWTVSVRDDGPGIDEEHRLAIFEKFFQTSHGENVPSGTGLGLAFVRIAVGRHQGRVSASASPTGGSIFVIELPAWREEDEDAEDDPASNDALRPGSSALA